VQALFPNPEHNILPGQFARVRVVLSQKKAALAVPQKAVLELQGLQSVYTVGQDGKALARSVVTGDRVGERWVIEQGLKVGDRVIVEGLPKLRPGAAVIPGPYRPPAASRDQGDK
jgi:membrane fusion protein (multidrug efflux system)